MATHDATVYEAYKNYVETGYDSYLLRICLSLLPLAQSVATALHLKSFDLDAAVNECFAASYFSFKNGSAIFCHKRALWEYYYKKYLWVCKGYIVKSIKPKLERNLHLEDVYRVQYIFSRPRTTKEVEDKIFIEEELPAILRKEFKRKLRFVGKDRKCCLRMLDAALAGRRIQVSKFRRFETKHSYKMLRDYTRVLIRSILYQQYKKFSDSMFVSEKLAFYYDNQ